VRGSVESHFFPRRSDQDTILIVEERPDPASTPADPLPNVLFPIDTIASGNFEFAPGLDPIEFGEGIGVNVDFLTRYYLEASAQLGLAARQTVTNRSYSARTTLAYERARSKYEIGGETNFLAIFRLGDQATVDLRSELFFPNGNLSRMRLVDITADSRIYLSRYVEIGYVFQVRESVADVENRYPRTHSFSLRFSLNY
jgi:hypothetical protein